MFSVSDEKKSKKNMVTCVQRGRLTMDVQFFVRFAEHACMKLHESPPV